MSSKSQTNANRTNAKESTNPRTGDPLGQGKARSSRNSTVHGLTGKSPILPGENPADLLDLAGRYRTGLHPDRQVEEDLVERMAIATYRLRRIARIEVGYFDLRLRYQSVPEQINQDGRADPLAFAYHYDCNEDQVFDRLSRYESRIQREYSRCLKETPEQPASATPTTPPRPCSDRGMTTPGQISNRAASTPVSPVRRTKWEC